MMKSVRYKAAVRYEWKEKRNVLLLGVAVMSLCLLLFGYYYDTKKDIESQRKAKLQEENSLSAHYFQSVMKQKQEWLDMFAYSAGMTEKDDSKSWWEFLKKFAWEETRVAVTDKNGIMYFGEHQQKDVHEKEYFKRAVEGENYISSVNKKGMNQNDSIIFSAPLKNINEEILGTAVMEYTTIELGKYINNFDADWGRYGVNLIIDSKGRLVASYLGMEKYDTIYEMLDTREWENKSSIAAMKKNVELGKPGYLSYTYRGVGRMLYYEPMELKDWTVVTIGAMDKFMPMLQTMEKRSIVFSLLFAGIILCIFVIMVKLIRHRDLNMKRMKQDLLTDVYSRSAGEEIIQRNFEQGRKQAYYGCMFIDVDDFKFFNDTYGHDRGDAILKQLGEILKTSFREQDVVYRYGGDEFCVWLSGTGGKAEIENAGQRILFRIDDAGIEAHMSVGATVIEKTETDWKAIIKRADEAVYLAKKRGKNQIVFDRESDI